MSDTYEIRRSQYSHPEQRGGQHANGPASLFVRRPDGPWYRVRLHAAYKVDVMIATYGFDHFAATHCDPVPPESKK